MSMTFRHALSRLAATTAALAALAALTTVAAPASTSASMRSSYVVVLAPTADCAATRDAVTATYGIRSYAPYDAIFCGFSARLSAEQATSLRSDPAVQSVTFDQPVGVG
jgi:type IV pilus biogenesis protein CpaD/CtpE